MDQKAVENIYGPIRQEADKISLNGDFQSAIKYLEDGFHKLGRMDNFFVQGYFWRSHAAIMGRHEKYLDALKECEKSSEAYQNAGSSLEAAKSKVYSIILLGYLSRVEEAEILATQLLPEFVDFLPGQLIVKSNLGQIYSGSGELEKALKIFKELHEFAISAGLKTKAIDYLGDMALQYSRLGRFSEALSAYDEISNALSKNIYGDSNDYYQVKLSLHRGFVLVQMGRFEETLELFEAVKGIGFVATHTDRGLFDITEGVIRGYLGDIELAQHYFEQALDHLTIKLDLIESQIHYSRFLRSSPLHHYSQALKVNQTSLNYLETIEHRPFLKQVYMEQAETLIALKRLPEAQAAVTNALSVQLPSIRPIQDNLLQLINADASVYHRPEESIERYKTAAANDSVTTELQIRAYAGLGKAHALQNSHRESAKAYRTAIDLIQRWRRNVSGHASQAGFMQRVKGPLNGLLASLVAQQANGAEILTVLERVNGQALADLGSMAQMTVEGGRIAELFTQREQVLRQLDLFTRPAIGEENDVHQQPVKGAAEREAKRLTELKAELVRLEEMIRREYPQWEQSEVDKGPIDWPMLVPDDTALLTWFETETDLYILTVCAGNVVYHRLESRLDDLDEMWQKLFHSYGSRRAGRAVQRRAADLWRGLTGPVADQLDEVTDLAIIPYDKLWQIPFGSLYLADDDRYVAEKWRLTSLPNLQIWQACRAKTNVADGVLLAGAPGRPNEPNHLPAVLTEIEMLANSFPEAAMLIDADVTRENLLANLSGKRLIHFAGHIEFDPQRPEHSGLRLYNGRYFRASDFYLQPGLLGGAQVVLSGCDSGRAGYGGNEIVGLAGSLIAAGAKSVLVTLWPVADVAVADFMARFYGHLKAGLPTSAALQAAQAEMANGDYSNPIDWAPFVALCA